MKKDPRTLYEFGSFLIDPEERLLLHEGKPIHVTTRAFETLLVLIRSRGHLIKKSELMRAVWADSFVEEGNLTVAISVLRKALGDDGNKHNFIQTIARRGYRFVGDVREAVRSDPELPAPLVGIRSLAVLPFRSMNSDAAHGDLGLRLTDAIVTRLASTGQIIVRPTSGMLEYTDTAADPLTVGREQK